MLEQVTLTNRLTRYALQVGFRESLSPHMSKPEYDKYQYSRLCHVNNNKKFRSFKSKENIH